MECKLEKELNHCIHFDGKGFCKNPDPNNPCGFLIKETKKPEKEPKWFEKYYQR